LAKSSGIVWNAPEEIITLDTILDLLRRQRALEFQPGDEPLFQLGYNLLAAIIAKATGQSFRAWTDANLFRPLQMDHTHVCEDPAEVVPIAPIRMHRRPVTFAGW